MIDEEKPRSTSNKFILTEFNLANEQANENIISMASSKKNIFFLTKDHNIFLVDSISLKTINELYSLPEPKQQNEFKEKIDKIWSDREGNHCIIRHNNSIYYFNNTTREPIELEKFKNIEICAVALDDRNTDYKTTKNFLAVDYDNKIYECCIEVSIEGKNKKQKIKDRIEELTTICFVDSIKEDPEEKEAKKKVKPLKERVYGIKFFHTMNNNIDQNSDSCYVIAVTGNYLFQFSGPGLKSFKQLFSRYDRNPELFDDTYKYFPNVKKNPKVEFDILYSYNEEKKLDVISQFGWRTGSGYCWSKFIFNKNHKGGDLPLDLKTVTIIPFQKITEKGEKKTNLNPISATHTNNHIFFLYDDCITVISKLTSNIIHTQYLNIKFDKMIYHEFSKNNGIILLSSKNGLYQIPLNNENNDIWKDYLELGEYENAIKYSESKKSELHQKISRINAEEEFNKNTKITRSEAAKLYAKSDEKFEIVCLKYLKEKDLDGLKLYFESYKEEHLKVDDNNKEDVKKKSLQLNMINTWLIEIMLNKEKIEEKQFFPLIRKNIKYLNKEILFQVSLNYGKTKEYIDIASIFGDYERAIIYLINQGRINDTLELFSQYAIAAGEKELKELLDIFLRNSHLFFKSDPSGSIDLLNTFMNNKIDGGKNAMENVIQALMSMTDKYNKIAKLDDKDKKNIETIFLYLKSLMEHSNQIRYANFNIKDQLNNIQNLYIFYLSINPLNKTKVIEYLKKYLEVDQKGKRKQTVLFQLDYAKRLLKDNKLAYALVLALMGKYSEGVYYALKKDTKDKNDPKTNQIIAEYIANNATDQKLRKKLWIEIFRNYCESDGDSESKESKFSHAIKIMEDSKILKIEDVLPHITDSIKIEEFKKQISDCINQYEKNIKGLKNNIETYNKIAENIKNDIDKINKRSMEIKYNEFKCEICKGFIKNKNIFLFPCGHMFDMNCIRETLLSYEMTGLDYLHDDNVLIDKLFYDLGYISQRVFVKSEKENKKNEIKKADDKSKKKKKNEIKKEKEEEEEKIDEEKKIEIRKKLNNTLSKQCVLCGDFLVDSIQCSLNQKDSYVDSSGYQLSMPKEPDFKF